LRIATGELPPYATAQRADSGVALHIVRRAFESAGHSVQFTFLPWSRAQLETLEGHWDASAHWGASAERRAKFLLSDSILSEQWQMLHRRSTALDWRTPADLQPYTVGLLRDYTYTPELWAEARAGRLKFEQPSNDISSLRMLLAGRIDVLPIERFMACDLLAQHFTAAQTAQLMMHPRLMTDSFTTHVIFPPSKPNSESLRQDFNRGLKKLKDSGAYRKLLGAAVACPSDWPASK
jgi:polar amino acid transport system substrate-binding protein